MYVGTRPWRIEDAAVLHALANDFDVSRWMTEAFQYPYSLRDAEDWITRASLADPSHFFAIEMDGIVVGGAGIEPCEGSHRGVAILGYWLGKDYWCRGIASTALHILVEEAFSRGFRRLEAHVFEPNIASARVLQKCGFVMEGRLRASYVQRDGTPCDALVFARINPKLV